MLVLSRKVGESIVCPSLGVRVVVVAIKGDKVRLAVEAPREVPVHREEVQRWIEEDAAALARHEDPLNVKTDAA